MKTIDITKPVKLKHPQKGEQNLIFRIVNFNEVTNRCYIEPITSLPGIDMKLAPQELVSIDDIENTNM